MFGDARLTLAASPDHYDLIVLDAFSSEHPDAPAHARALRGIWRAKPHGVIVMHISNRHLELATVVANVAQSQGLVSLPARRRPAPAIS